MTTDFRIYTVTWNVAEAEPPADLTCLLRLDKQPLPNAYAVGFQELKAGTRDLLSRSVYDDSWTAAVTIALCAKNFVRVKTVNMVGIALLVFVHRRDIEYVTNVEAISTPTGIAGIWGNKGGVSVRMDISGIDICFVNCHLAAHLPQVQRRISNYEAIVAHQTFSDPKVSTILEHDYVFWIGDLNFRIDDIPNDETKKRIEDGDLEYLLQYDQLSNLRKEGLVLIDFEEGPIKFNPTYKFDTGTHIYDTSKKQRKPGWCDRVLWMVHEDSFEGVDLNVKQLSYDSITHYVDSDHMPVAAEFIVQVLRYPPEMPVMFEPINHWCSGQDGSFSYSANSQLSISSWDWIGLYKIPNNYVEGHVGDFCLAYYSSRKDCLVGFSDVFKIALTEESDTSSSSDDEASDDDEHIPPLAAKGGTRPKTAGTRRRAPEL